MTIKIFSVLQQKPLVDVKIVTFQTIFSNHNPHLTFQWELMKEDSLYKINLTILYQTIIFIL